MFRAVATRRLQGVVRPDGEGGGGGGRSLKPSFPRRCRRRSRAPRTCAAWPRGPSAWGCPWRLPAASRARGQGGVTLRVGPAPLGVGVTRHPRFTLSPPGSPQVAGRGREGDSRHRGVVWKESKTPARGVVEGRRGHPGAGTGTADAPGSADPLVRGVGPARQPHPPPRARDRGSGLLSVLLSVRSPRFSSVRAKPRRDIFVLVPLGAPICTGVMDSVCGACWSGLLHGPSRACFPTRRGVFSPRDRAARLPRHPCEGPFLTCSLFHENKNSRTSHPPPQRSNRVHSFSPKRVFFPPQRI